MEGRLELVRVRAVLTSFRPLQHLVAKGDKDRSSPKHKSEPVCMSRIASVHTLYQQACLCTDLGGAAKLPKR